MIRHIVMWKFKEGPDKEENIETFRKGLLSLTDCVPGILSMQFGNQMKILSPEKLADDYKKQIASVYEGDNN